MNKLRMGVMGCADIAWRAMIPAMVECAGVELAAVASRTAEKAGRFADRFDCDAITGYETLLQREDIQAVYMPLPPGLHEQWVVKTLESGKHVLVEKSFATSFASAQKMVDLARQKKLLIMENFLFPHHSQYAWIKDLAAQGELGDIHLLRSTFGFPSLPKDNYRYSRELGGGALLDAGAYVVKASRLFLGQDLVLLGADLRYDDALGVDVFGNAMFKNSRGQTAQVSFGFDCKYQCTLELLGTRGKLFAERFFTPPPGFSPVVHLEHQDRKQTITLPADNYYINKYLFFADAVHQGPDFSRHEADLLLQASAVEALRKKGTG